MRRLLVLILLISAFAPGTPTSAEPCSTRPLPRLWVIDDRGIMQRYGGGTETRCGGDAPTRQPSMDTWAFLQTPTSVEVEGADGRRDGVVKVTSDGGVHTFGTAFHGSAAGTRLAAPAVDVAFAGERDGYRILAADGGVFSYGDAPFRGSAAGARLTSPMRAIASTPTGLGYWIVGENGKIFHFGDAVPLAGPVALTEPIVAIEATATGRGVWLAGADGGVFAYGDAPFRGSAANLELAAEIVDIEVTPDGGGYWLLGRDGGTFAFGNADYVGGPAADGRGGSWAAVVRAG